MELSIERGNNSVLKNIIESGKLYIYIYIYIYIRRLNGISF